MKTGTVYRVTVEMVPWGSGREARVVASATITDLPGVKTSNWRDDPRDYEVALFKARRKAVWKTARVLNVSRRRLSVWDLVFCALRAAVGDRNPEGDNGATELGDPRR